jgi:hypothetical protein
VNIENEERIFQQAKTIANTTNRKPENVLPSILLRLQAKQLNGKMSLTLSAAETEVRKVARNVPEYECTSVTPSFISSRSCSWQAHLERISPYLEGKWWLKNGGSNSLTFFDGDRDPDFHIEGPILHSFRSTEIVSNAKFAWSKILADAVSVPCIPYENSTRMGVSFHSEILSSPQTLVPLNKPMVFSKEYLPLISIREPLQYLRHRDVLQQLAPQYLRHRYVLGTPVPQTQECAMTSSTASTPVPQTLEDDTYNPQPTTQTIVMYDCR